MILVEPEAYKHWCPLNHAGMGEEQQTACTGSECMLWVWTDEAQRRGHCGMSREGYYDRQQK